MKKLALVAITTMLACSQEGSNDLPVRRNAPAEADDTGSQFDHIKESIGGQNGITDTKQRRIEELAYGTPMEVARLHGAQKISYVALGKMLGDFGVDLKDDKKNTLAAGSLYTEGKSALGAPLFGSRTPEMMAPSTSALAKQMDIFVASADQIIANIGHSKRCPGVVLVDDDKKLTSDGLACLTGKPVTDEFVSLANKMITEVGDSEKGPAIAVATILAASHISE